MTNSRAKGARGEREARDAVNMHLGMCSIRSAQAGGKFSADLLHTGNLHCECKKRRTIAAARFMDQAVADCGTRIPVVVMREDRGGWLLVVRIEDARRFAAEITSEDARCGPRTEAQATRSEPPQSS